MQTKESTESIAASQTARRRVFSGIQPSGDLQLGNYLGAMKRWFEEQGEKENFFCVVDLHAMTVHQDPAELRRLTRAVAAMNIAAGLDTSVSTLFIQSHVSTHAEACWLLNCVTPLGWLERMTQYKDKSAKQESVSAGLLDYPVLMAGDILLYDTHEVPVGDDQKQHVELARDIAQRFNHLYGDTFVVPEPMIAKSGARIMGFNDPTVKMSKAYSHIPGHAVKMLDEPDDIKRTIMRAVTDSGREIRFSSDPEKAGVNNLLEIYKVITGKDARQVEADFEDARGYGDLKKRLVEVVVETLRPIRERYNDLMTDLGELDRLLAAGAARAEEVSGPKLKQMKEAMGLVVLRTLR